MTQAALPRVDGTPLLSIVVLVYNTAPFLRECLDSLLEQDYRNTRRATRTSVASANTTKVARFQATSACRWRVVVTWRWLTPMTWSPAMGTAC